MDLSENFIADAAMQAIILPTVEGVRLMVNKIKVSRAENLPQTFLREIVTLLEFMAFFGAIAAMWHFGAAQSAWVWMAVSIPLLIAGVFISALVRNRLGLVKGRFER